MIAVIDYGMGNIHSVAKALQVAGAEVIVTSDPAAMGKSEKLVLPGVGAFDDAMAELKRQGLVAAIKEAAGDGKPLLGICLGMQLLFESSDEAPGTEGLGIIKGRVKRFSAAAGLKVPHMGWNALHLKNAACPLVSGIPEGTFVYFCHSYYPVPREDTVSALTCEYGLAFTCGVMAGRVYGVQFHPEKSQRSGLQMMRNFVRNA